MASKYGVLNEQMEVVEVFASQLDADERAAEIGGRVDELVENLWWIESDWTEDGVNYITAYRNSREFAATVERLGMKLGKLAELCGRSLTTMKSYSCGAMKPPKLVIEKVQELDRFINPKKF
jgi:hypothetical protein